MHIPSHVNMVGGACSNVGERTFQCKYSAQKIGLSYNDILPESSFHRIFPFDPSDVFCLVHLAALSCVYILLNVKVIFKFDVIKFPSHPNYPNTS